MKSKFNSKFKKIDPISFALVLILGASAIFAGIQMAINTGTQPVSVLEGDDSIPAHANPEIQRLLEENFAVPIDGDNFEVTLEFFNRGASDATELTNSFFFFPVGGIISSTQSFGTSFSGPNDEVVNVVAALSGTVVAVDERPILGTVVTIEHENGVQTVYTGVYDATVEEGMEVAQGDVLGTTGLSTREPDAGNVVHFEVIHNDSNVNPQTLFGSPLGDL